MVHKFMNLLVVVLVTCLAISCSKDQEIENKVTAQKNLQNAETFYYHYEGKAYLIRGDKDGNGIIPDDDSRAFEEVMLGKEGVVALKMPHYSDEHIFFFDSRMDGYDFLEKDFNPLIGRKFKFSYRIDELRENLIAKYGNRINYQDLEVKAEILNAIKTIYQELNYNGALPEDLEAFVGIEAEQFHPSRNHVLIVYEHNGGNGASLQVETAANTTIWNYGPNNCYTLAGLPDLGLETMSGSTSWDNQISSRNFQYISGADAMGIVYCKHRHYLTTSCNYAEEIVVAGSNVPLLRDFGDTYGGFLNGLFCGTMDNTFSSIKIKAIWQGCYNDPNQFSDLYTP